MPTDIYLQGLIGKELSDDNPKKVCSSKEQVKEKVFGDLTIVVLDQDGNG